MAELTYTKVGNYYISKLAAEPPPLDNLDKVGTYAVGLSAKL